jgi:hypothetical protein
MIAFVERYGIFCLIVVTAVVYPVFRIRRGHALVSRWAAKNGYEIVRRQWSLFRVGPFPLAALGKQAIYRLVVRDREGRESSCWLKVGDFFVGLLDDAVTVKWEDDDPFAAHRSSPT